MDVTARLSNTLMQYLPLEPVTHGIKIRCITCLITKFVLNLEVSVDAANEALANLPQHACGIGARVVTRLLAGWENCWHTVVIDNFFTSPMFFEDMMKQGFYGIGTARQGRVDFLTSLNLPKKGTRSTLEIRMHKDRQLYAIH